MKLRAALAGDCAILAEVHAAAFETGWNHADIRQLLGGSGAFGLVAEIEDGRLAGFVLARVIAGEAEVLTLAVRAEQRRRGVGRALLAAAQRLAASTAEAMVLEVAADNAGALALYEAAGYAAVGRRAAYYARRSGAGADAIVMRRPLNR
ncbi:MAG TPA: ribosomal protein S18-alanine N-acetyltransferase [Caulobacteraceae bacterium]|nr:ribosomal protein S18-alanine N-acetyltransferase [Caulobacteraceae bacterium]